MPAELSANWPVVGKKLKCRVLRVVWRGTRIGRLRSAIRLHAALRQEHDAGFGGIIDGELQLAPALEEKAHVDHEPDGADKRDHGYGGEGDRLAPLPMLECAVHQM